MSDPRRLFLFLLAGGLNTIFGYAVFASLIWLGLSASGAVVIGTMAGVLFNFGSIGTVFRARERWRFPRFLLVYAAILAANLLLMHGLIQAGVPVMVGQAAIILLLAPLSFAAMRGWVFAPSPRHPESCT